MRAWTRRSLRRDARYRQLLGLVGSNRGVALAKTACPLRETPLTEALWKAITEHKELPRHVSILREVKVLESRSGGVGIIRKCTLTSGKSFHERVTVWEEGHRYCYQPNTAETPFNFNWAEACWSIEASAAGSRLTYRLQYEPRSRLRDLINYPLLRTYGVWQIKKMLKSYAQPT